ncbi:MAG: ABC transporter substrate-binding protein [Actinomycetota bacterium]|nr:ABC transporter substrate-binding protein [Actinomycetota bacterium]
MSELLTGTVTFLFTDIEGSTRLVARLGERYADVLSDHQRILRDAFEANDGREIDTQGDSFFVAFPRARDAVAAAVDGQRALAAHSWPDGTEVKVRMGLHTGEPTLGGERYIGLGVHRAARIAAAAHGGQVLLSSVTRGLIEDELPEGVSLLDLEAHRLKDLDRPETLSQLVIEGLPADFPEPRTAGREPLAVAGREQELAREAEAALGGTRLAPAWTRGRWTAATAAVLALAGGIAAAVVLSTGGSGSQQGDFVGNGLAVIDPGKKSVDRYLRLGSSPSNVATGDGAVWVLDGDDLTISKIDPKTKAVARTFSSGQIPTDLAVSRGAIWVGNGELTSGSQQGGTVYAASVSRIDQDGNTVKTRLPGRESSNLVDFSFRIPGVTQLVADRDAVWAVNPDRTVSQLDLETGKRLQVVRRVKANAIAAGGLGVWIIDDEHTLARIDRRGRDTRPVTPDAAGFIGIAVGDESVWATDPFEGTVWRVDLDPQPLTQTIPVGVGVTGIAYGDGQVWVSNFLDGTVSRIDPKSNTVAEKIFVRGTPKALAVGEGGAWLTVNRSTVASCPLSYEGKGKPDYVIASDLPLHGPAGTLTTQMTAGIRLVLAQRHYRAGKHSIGYRSCDDSTAQGGAFDFYKCAANAHAYAEDHTVIGVVGTYNSACAHNQVRIMNEVRPGPVTMVSPANTDPALTHRVSGLASDYFKGLYPTGSRNFARVVPPDDYQGAAMAVLARELRLRRVFVLSASSPESFGADTLASFNRAAKRLRLPIAGRATWDPADTSYRSLAGRVARTRAQGVFIGDANLNGEQLIRDLRARLGPRVKILLNNAWLPVRQLIEKTGPAAVGVYVPYYSLADGLLPPAGKRFVRELGANEPAPIQSFGAAPAAQAAQILLDAIARTDGSRAAVNREVHAAQVENGLLGNFRFNADGDVVPAPFTIFRIVGGTPPSGTNIADFDGAVADRAVSIPERLLR